MGEGVQKFTHLSASSITSFVQRRSVWWAERVMGQRLPVSPAMIRGNAVETGVRFALLGDDIDASVKRALDQYEADCTREKLIDLDGKIAKERDVIAPSIELAVEALAGFGVPKYDDNGRQQKVSIFCRYGDSEDDRIEVIGFLDFVFDGLIVDLKSTGRMPSTMSWGHQVQRAIYARATGLPVKFCYCSPKKVELKEDGDIDVILASIKQAVRAMDAVLRLDVEQQRLLCLPDPDDFIWTGQEETRRQLFGV